MGIISDATLKAGSICLRTMCFGHVFFTHFYTCSETKGESMFPTIQAEGDFVHLLKLGHLFGKNIKVGDVVISLKPMDPEQGVCKRITGMPGDIILIDPSSNYHWNNTSSNTQNDQSSNSSRILKSENISKLQEKIQILKNIEDSESKSKSKSKLSKLSKVLQNDTNQNQNQIPQVKPIDPDPYNTFIKIPPGHCWVTGDNLPYSSDSRSYGLVPLALIQGKCYGVSWFKKEGSRKESEWSFIPFIGFKKIKNSLEDYKGNGL